MVRALFHAFPHIGLRENQFRHVSSTFTLLLISSIIIFLYILFEINILTKRIGMHWSSLDNRRAVFEQIAARYNFDPLVASNWYPFSTDDIQAEKVYYYRT